MGHVCDAFAVLNHLIQNLVALPETGIYIAKKIIIGNYTIWNLTDSSVFFYDFFVEWEKSSK